MYISIETINDLAKLLGSLAVIVGTILAVYKFIQRDKRQGKICLLYTSPSPRDS